MSHVAALMTPFVGHLVDLLLRNAVFGHHMPTQASHRLKLLVADGAARLPVVFLHVLQKVAALGVPCSTDLAYGGVWEKGDENDKMASVGKINVRLVSYFIDETSLVF